MLFNWSKPKRVQKFKNKEKNRKTLKQQKIDYSWVKGRLDPLSSQKLIEIGLHFGIGVSGVSQAIRRVALQIKDDKKLNKKIDRIISDLNLSTVQA